MGCGLFWDQPDLQGCCPRSVKAVVALSMQRQGVPELGDKGGKERKGEPGWAE